MNRSRFLLGLVLTAIAGAIDAVSFIRFGAVYASFMSGNTVQFGINLAGGAWPVLGHVAALIGAFMGGGFLGGLAVAATGRWAVTLLLSVNAGLACGAIWLDLAHAVPLYSTLPLSLAMGMQNHLTYMVRGANPGTTFVTGTAFRFGDAVAQRVLGRDPHGAWRYHFAVWLVFGLGAALGTVSQVELHPFALAPIAATLVVLAFVNAVAAIAESVKARRLPSQAAA